MVHFSFANQDFRVVGEHALFWPAQNALLVADLHLEKASFFARSGQMLPPYDSHATVLRVADLVRATGATSVYCLGDNFHDDAGEARLEGEAAFLLQSLTTRLRLHWISGNHDAALAGIWGGTVVEEIEIGGIMLRHAAEPSETRPEISGHFHPKYRVVRHGRHIVRRCFVASDCKLILPAFGALTGGLAADDEAIWAAMGRPDQASALFVGDGKLLEFALLHDPSPPRRRGPLSSLHQVARGREQSHAPLRAPRGGDVDSRIYPSITTPAG